jgi:NADH:ubiquinone oxidoreductase subunit F (NADH-binding)/(2Fe-2S) ferredoxin
MATDVMANYAKLAATAEEALVKAGELGKIRIQVGSATCEDAAGAKAVMTEFKRLVKASGRSDIAVRQVGCTGRCSREPIVNVIFPGQLPVKYEMVDPAIAGEIFKWHVSGGVPVPGRMLDAEFQRVRQYDFLFCGGTHCLHRPITDLRDAFIRKLEASGGDGGKVSVISSNCFGLCTREQAEPATHILVRPTNVMYRVADEADLDELIREHVQGGRIVRRLVVAEPPVSQRFFDLYGDVAFFNKQSRIALRNSGIIDPESLHEYVHYEGFKALAKALERGDRQWVIGEIKASNLRGRGGAGYPTGTKWSFAAAENSKVKYVICNADEGDPGAFMDRSMLEGDPFSVIEGMMIGAFAMGASQGFCYIRAEYPTAIKRVQKALDQCRKAGLLGKNILGAGFDFDVEIRLGAGAFVCGEETSLIHSIEGARGQPSVRPPYPTTAGLWGKPTCINNVETFANVPVIVLYGSSWFARLGTPKSGGTKVFALAGKVRHTGLVEVPMGTSLREIIFDIGGGVSDGKELKAVQTGGPAGGFIPADQLDMIVDYEPLTAAGSIMGSGGMIVVDQDDCMVDVARFYMAFSADESCGKCTPCREGSTRMLEILNRIAGGEGQPEDIAKLERLAKLIHKASLCGLGRAAPNPILSTLKHFRAEYEMHVREKRCPTGRCPMGRT